MEDQRQFFKMGRRIWASFIWNNKGMYVLGVLTVFLCNLMQILYTRNIGWILDFFNSLGGIDRHLPHYFDGLDKRQTFLALFLLLFVSRFFLFIGRMGWRLTLARQTHKASGWLRELIWDSARFFKMSDIIHKFPRGVLMSASTSDVNQARFIFGFTLVALADFLFLSVLTLGTMLTINVKMTMWALAVLLFIPFAVRKLSQLEVIKYRKFQETLGEFNDLSAQVISTIRLQRLSQTGFVWVKKLRDGAEKCRFKKLDSLLTSLRYMPIMGTSSLLSTIVLFSLGIGLVFKGDMSIGDFVAMQGLIFLLEDPLFELGFIISDFQRGFTSMERLSEIIYNERDPSLVSTGGKKIVEDGATILETNNMNFCFSDSQSPLIRDFSLSLKKGDRIGITGPIGAGKSTLVKILSGLERNIDGELLFFGRPFNQYGHGDLRKYIGYIPQKPFLFADTIGSNIRMDQELSDEEVWSYLDMAGLKEDVENFPDKLDTTLGEWGINLSGGQKQRMTLARALAKKPRLLFLDDCLSAVDTVTEEKILNSLDKELKDTTLVWVAHRTSTLKYCNQILELA